ncbi:MAG: lysine--tRNA ligase [candidate division Zixibacteria bacterium]|nr:lysine--tRNA ligase [candidate division Zixibacteria bacterium]NIR62921.1 lysine--tRNA ligase [candidate division Zixibacteria bacterium]NIS16058.1 lysine--tRNA ligase [candidate division Zixibacteria bacterium]NIS44931.1 lysine--tRNA ligase [candidate division Zixibacteria bacterium]NIT52469.1 lysine--tRNA ligase [candidate division Zixibacteria bacterium]
MADETKTEINEDIYIQARRAKLEKIREMGINPFPYRFEKDTEAEYVFANFDQLENTDRELSLAGRIMTMRMMGKASFCHIQDESGQIQLYIRKDDVGDDQYKLFKLLDIGDIIGVTGPAFRTKKGEISIKAHKIVLLSKALRPLPEKWHGLKDVETRFRQRYLDLIANPEVRKLFVKRSRLINAMRSFLDGEGFVEMETPVLQPLYGGASARPFVTHHNALDVDLFLRIADELYLKRLIIGGYEKVYEVCKDFRNEGIDRYHNPEFTMIEFYMAYADYHDIMELIKRMLLDIATKVFGKTEFEFAGNKFDLNAEWEILPILDSIKQYAGIDAAELDDEALVAECERLGIEIEKTRGRPKILDDIFTEKVQPNLIQPTFITDHPLEMSPLAKIHRDNPNLTERFELYVAGSEVCNAFSELNDPDDQRERFRMQQKFSKLGDEEAQQLDEDFLKAMEYGMPPTGGLGIGVDRLFMILTGKTNIREVILFPQLKPE